MTNLLRYLKFATPALAAIALALTPSSAKADDFTFSFVNTDGTVSGTVTGIIYGLTNNSTGAATDVVITSFPAGLESIYPAGPIDTNLWSTPLSNSFTETNGQITDADFLAYNNANSFPQGSQLYLNGFDYYNYVNIDGIDVYYVQNEGAFAGATYAPLSVSSTPEPSSLVLLATGLAGAAGSIRRRFRR